jgi:hypothetical protein
MRFATRPARLALATCLAWFSLVTHAADAPAQRQQGTTTGGPSSRADGGGHPGGPPPEALAVCSSLKSGDACSFKGRDRDLKGTCWAPPGKPLACRPSDRPERPREAPASAPR